ncbi:MAG TPA: serine/threonine-protein kinase, partial [Polyangiaceae bacterium]|nr:serine/threonine-protein kinase [Polyangiaceae bacterium]
IQSKGRIAPVDLYPIAHQLLAALHAAHTAGIIHRDLKPDNVYLLKARGGVADFVKLLDFGISKFNQLSGDSGFSMTRTGAVMGTPYYMAPEQAKGAKDMDHRVDLYATGVILYESVTGQVPFNADTFNELLFKIVLEEPRPIEQLVPDIDSNFAAIINKAMARDPSTRFQSARDFQIALEQWANGAGAELTNALRLPAAKPNAESTGGFARQPAQAQLPMLGTGTPGNWSNTGGAAGQNEAPQKKSKAGLFAALGAVAVIAIGGAVVGMRAGKANSAAAATDRVADEEKAKAESLAAAAKAQQAEADLKAEEARKAEEDKKAADAASANKVVVAPSGAELPKAKASLAQQAHAAARPAAAAAPKETAKATPAAAPPPPPATTGRKIRTSL